MADVQIIIPRYILDRFSSIASKNTEKNVETIGLLCGKKIEHQALANHTASGDVENESQKVNINFD